MSGASPTPTPAQGPEVVLVTGISGSGKSVALHALEDAGFFCVDNLPPELLREFIRLEHERFASRIAVAVDIRTAGSLPALVPLIEQLRREGVRIRSVFLEATTEALVRRFSESRRPHPLSASAASVAAHSASAGGSGRSGETASALMDAIELERTLLADLREVSTVIDTSQLRPAQLRAWLRELVEAAGLPLTVVFESFAFKRGVPLDADFVFDLRAWPNPYYIRHLRPLTGRDAPVSQYLQAQPEVVEMLGQIEAFLRRWLPSFEGEQRGYVTVALGCTGGQHRSVHGAEELRRRFADRPGTLVRHRELGTAG
ncbi:MAG: hypothetical protein RI988_636 [Pseudomonadota bacterium]|jgi:UPF0042 nucleotide-binding protein